MSLRDFFIGQAPIMKVSAEPEPVDPASILHIAVLAVRYGRDPDVSIQWAWTADCDERYALGAALKTVRSDGIVIAQTTIRIPVASGTETEGEDRNGLRAEHDGPTAEGGDAQ